MIVPIRSAQELGLLIRATRKTQHLRMDDVAGCAGVGPVFVREVERGKDSVQLGRVMKLLAELGIELSAHVSDDVQPALNTLKTVGVKPLPARRGG
jgi:transcriptional regulator with XRE-family HTH domain